MPARKRRYLTSAIIAMFVLFAALALQFALEWRNALNNINAMIVTPVVLPPAQAADSSQTSEAATGVAALDAPITATESDNTETAVLESDVAAPPEPNTAPVRAPATDPLPADIIVDDGTVNILLLGTDARPDAVSATRTDAIVLVHLNQQTGRVSMLSLPRDLWVDYPRDLGEGRINAAYPLGESEYGTGGGAALAKATVQELLDLHVDYFILVNFDGFKTIIDEINGIRIDVPEVIVDPRYPTEDNQTMEIRFEPGLQWMYGERALMYARTRHADSDFGRNQRQQQVLMAIFERVRDKGMLRQLTSFDNYTAALRDYVRTDMSRDTMLQLATWGRSLETDQIRRYAIDASLIVPLKEPATFAARSRDLRNLVARMTGEASGSAGGE